MSEPVAVITPLLDPDPEYLLDSYADLRQQTMPWRWYLQHDAATATTIPAVIAADPRVSVGVNGRWLGSGGSRNLALARAAGEAFVYAHDYDDRLAPGAFVALLAPMCANPQVGWVAGSFGDLHYRAGRWEAAPFLYDVPPGPVPAGAWIDLMTEWPAPCAPALPAPTSMMWRSELLYGLGGWGGVPRGEDTLLVQGAYALADGYLIGESTGWYRKHDQQKSRDASSYARVEREAALLLARRREAALRAQTGRRGAWRFGSGTVEAPVASVAGISGGLS